MLNAQERTSVTRSYDYGDPAWVASLLVLLARLLKIDPFVVGDMHKKTHADVMDLYIKLRGASYEQDPKRPSKR